MEIEVLQRIIAVSGLSTVHLSLCVVYMKNYQTSEQTGTIWFQVKKKKQSMETLTGKNFKAAIVHMFKT